VRWGSIDLKTLDSDTVIPILVFCLLLAWYLPAVVGKYRGNSSHALRHGAIWLGLIDVGGDMIVIYKRADEAHFNIKSYVNNQSAEFVLDTGASAVVLTHGTAQRLGLLPAEGGYTQTVSTANGMTKVAPIRIDELRIGSIIIKDIKASVAQPDELDVNLLGMSFLSRLKGYAVEADQLTLRQ
jgi:aspartyl protease family protein